MTSPLASTGHTHCPGCGCPLGSGQPTCCEGCQFPLQMILDRYRVLKHLGSGGFGKLYLAADTCAPAGAQRATRVIKFLRDPEAATETQKIRFRREIRVTTQLASTNPHVVRIFAHGDLAPLGPFYVMEYLDGETLSARLTSQRPLSTGLIFRIFRQLCAAVGYAHSEGIIHRDLKPCNLFLCGAEEDRILLKLLDFGLAKEQRSDFDSLITNGAIGTLRYMPPEQWNNWEANPVSDVYTMGAILYEMLTRKPIFCDVELTRFALGTAHVYQRPKPLSLCRTDIEYPPGLEGVLEKALEKHPDLRYETPAAFWEAVAPFASWQREIALLPEAPERVYEVTSDFSGASLPLATLHKARW